MYIHHADVEKFWNNFDKNKVVLVEKYEACNVPRR